MLAPPIVNRILKQSWRYPNNKSEAVLQYQMKVASEYSSFTARFDADSDETALAHVKAWARGAKLYHDGSVHIIRSDNTVIDVTEAVAPFVDQSR